ncbi:hypothetical protein B2A_07862 [mine drainage metagenome]|uniref:Calcineurin-like phosphoesterase domain-containing protein n=1 Tax=mine drainage metagenome TaxID=410659 RepID=T0ZW50_9ZZZZ
MMLEENIELIDGKPIAYLKDLKALAISDLHLGYEGMMSKEGVLIPPVNLKRILESIEESMSNRDVKSLIIDGDIKNEFSTVGQAEFNELYDLIMFSRSKKLELILIKGNHDNFVERYKEPFKLKVHRQEARIGRYLFFHGEEMPISIERGVEVLVMGHEHPAVGIYDSIGKQEKLKCFLYGKYKRRKLLVLPASNFFAGGTAVNIEPKENLLAPIFGRVDIDKMHAIVLGYGSTIDFGTVKALRKAAVPK